MSISDKARLETAALQQFLPSFLRTNPFQLYGVYGFAIGRKRIKGKYTDQMALCVFTACKLPIEEVPVQRRVPTTLCILTPDGTTEISVPTDVIEAPRGQLHMDDPESTLRPVPGGSSCSSSAGGNGTLGGWVWDKTDETIVMLSNAHVFGMDVGAEIIQPGTVDGGFYGKDRIGQVKRAASILPIPNNPTPADCNLADAAIGSPDNTDLLDLTVLDIGPAIYVIDTVVEGDEVQKFGQNSGLTEGVVTHFDGCYIFDFRINGVWQETIWGDLIRIEPKEKGTNFAIKGDSGSLVFKPNPDSVLNPVVGLYFAGNDAGPNNWGVACKIGNVFNALDLDTLCSGGFAAYLDALAEDENDGAMNNFVAATVFNERERRAKASTRINTGLARDVQARLSTSRRGRMITDFVDQFRGEILTLLIRDGDVRRSSIDLLRPILRGAVTTDDVLQHEISNTDAIRLDKLARSLERKSSSLLCKRLRSLPVFEADIIGKSFAELFGLNLCA
ncbi:MAG: hypothetical protein F6K14_08910 [Symploca sp. SIO2C1]|nr:hypothetical protein [Symploca sp. SIO2C1]